VFVLIVGGGKVGAHLAELLLASGHRVRVIELRAAARERLAQFLASDVIVAGSGSDPATLEACGARQADVMAAVTGDDEVNLVATSLARFEFNIPRTIARVNNPKNAWMFTAEMGVDVVLSQADLMAHLILEEMSLGDMMTLLKLRRGRYSLVEEKIAAGSHAAGRTIAALGLPRECIVVAIIRSGGLVLPRGDTVLQTGDEVLALVSVEQVQRLAEILGEAHGDGLS
jgi:trk system potassium uptake protein TrkA